MARIVGTNQNNFLLGTGLNDQLYGLAGNDSLHSGNGSDLLDGGPGNDKMEGASGNDTYVVDSPLDTIIEQANRGNDTVQSFIDYQLGAALENLTLMGSARTGRGNAANNILLGNDQHNHLAGGAGNDTIKGGAGNDHLYGEQGNDLLEGGTGNDYLDGGTGRDRLWGGHGNDVYVVDNVGDQVVERTNAGVDTVISSVNYSLGDPLSSDLENLTLTGNAYSGKGNRANNVLFGQCGQ